MNSTAEYWIIGLLLVSNLFAFLVTANDKRKSLLQQSESRTPEGTLFFLAAAFGAIGVYLAMLVFRHKTKKWYFQVGIPLMIMQNIATLALVQSWLG